MDKWDQQLIDTLMRSRTITGNNKQRRESKAASLKETVNKAQLINDTIFA